MSLLHLFVWGFAVLLLIFVIMAVATVLMVALEAGIREFTTKRKRLSTHGNEKYAQSDTSVALSEQHTPTPEAGTRWRTRENS